MSLYLLNLSLNVCQSLINRENITQRLSMTEKCEQAALLCTQIFETRLGIYIVARYVLRRFAGIEQSPMVLGRVGVEVAFNAWVECCLHREGHRDIVEIVAYLVIVNIISG